MAPAADSGHEDTGRLAPGRIRHPGEKHRRDRPRTHRPRPPRRPAKPAEIARMHQLHSEGLSGHVIAAKFGYRSSTSVYRKLALGQPPKPRWSDDENQVMVDGYAAGLGPSKIAGKLPGRSPLAIAIAMCRYRKAVQADERKRRTLRAIGTALRMVRKADIYREVTP